MSSLDHTADAAAVHSLDHFAIVVPDLAEATRFYSKFGVGIEEDRNSLAICCGTTKPAALVFEGGRKRLHHLSFGIYEADAVAFASRLQQRGIARLDPPPGLPRDGVWLRDPEGNLVELRIADKTSPDAKDAVSFVSAAP